MIVCKNLSKIAGEHRILENITFSTGTGDLVGILGPNGAGKTTTMRILSSYIKPSGGFATVGGFDVVKEAAKVRSIIGVLPENPPLYGELTVRQYVTFMGQLRGLSGKTLGIEVENTISRCRLSERTDSPCGVLSKGLRQKVGLAAALIGDPKVLFLDEPTSGLDPREITEIRALIRELKEGRTILFSSHILSEVRELCDLVVMFVGGRTVLDGKISDLCKEDSLENLFLNALSHD
ncbi:MAG TPA: ABC transporter ATP-binding protein [Oligoflexia bacterium]|nr:ABC transporter ATP-binding protein [Oligoflexia bacterium]HMP48538.1 ABC transporter ATP-binding protein [Oligoflexia bacterium]